jgi:hypothetical protein
MGNRQDEVLDIENKQFSYVPSVSHFLRARIKDQSRLARKWSMGNSSTDVPISESDVYKKNYHP